MGIILRHYKLSAFGAEGSYNFFQAREAGPPFFNLKKGVPLFPLIPYNYFNENTQLPF